MRRLAALLALSCAALPGCGEDEPSTPAASATPAPAAPTAPAEPSGGGAPFVGSLSVDPGDGTLVIGTGLGLYRLEAGAGRAQPFEGELRTPDAEGAISPNLVLRFTGPGDLIASGHPKDAASGLPEYLGLIASGDGGARWRPVSLLGDEDLHALDAHGDVVAGQPVDEARLLVSTDAGRTWDERTPPSQPVDVDLDPADPRRMALSTADGVFVSDDGGASWRQRDVVTTETHLAWAGDGTLYRVDAAGGVQVSRDRGERWEDAGNAGGPPTTITVDAKDRLYVALTGGVIARSDDGGASFRPLTTLAG